ncbi:Protein-tyrosine phosphatase, low molecular weight [Bdellovibrio bacteriovorus W]|nr:Protein-tyrosine phosphatase, low molecular weight [Bdellovibrio bacteriovorus W]
MKILFLCVANSARSQLAEGLAKSLLGDNVEIESAGSQPSGQVQPYAIQVLKEIGIDISRNYSKSYAQLPSDFMNDLDFVITLCAEEVCPVLTSTKAQKIHWPISDPVSHSEDPDEQIHRFRNARNLIESHLKVFSQELKGDGK